MKLHKNYCCQNSFKQRLSQLEKPSSEEVSNLKHIMTIDSMLNLLRFEEEFADRLRIYLHDQFINANTLTKVLKLEDIDSDIYLYKNPYVIINYAIDYVKKYYGDWIESIKLNNNDTLTVTVSNIIYASYSHKADNVYIKPWLINEMINLSKNDWQNIGNDFKKVINDIESGLK